MILHLNHKGKMTSCYYTCEDIEAMFSRQCGDKKLRERIDAKMKKTWPWKYVEVNGREMIDEAEKNRIVAAFEAAKTEAVREMEQERQDYLEKMYPNTDPKFRGMYAN